MKRVRLLLMLGAVLAIAVACIPVSTSTPMSTPRAQATDVKASAIVSATPTPIFVDEAACRDACHIHEPVEQVVASPMLQPVNHAGRSTCLSCHATLAKPVLPASHGGWVDSTCVLCHKPSQ